MIPPPAPAGDADQLSHRLLRLRQSLLELHKTLIDSERIFYEKAFGRIESQNRLLQLLIQDPWFAWLHPLSELVVQIDEALEGDEPVTGARTAELIQQARSLLVASEEGNGFSRSYFDALQREPDVVLAHAGVMTCLKRR